MKNDTDLYIFLGAGVWAQALASHYSSAVLYSPDAHQQYEKIQKAAIVFAATSTDGLGAVTEALQTLDPSTPVITLTKGIEPRTKLFAYQFIADRCPHLHVGILGGPTFAGEVKDQQPTIAMLGFDEFDLCVHWANILSDDTLFIIPTQDSMGIAFGGVYKNVLAIISGFLCGMHVSHNTWAMILTKGFQDFYTLGLNINVYPETLLGPAGFGDYLLSVTTEQSRNFAFGKLLALNNTEAHNLKTVEGVKNIHQLLLLSSIQTIQLPSVQIIKKLIEQKISKQEALFKLIQSVVEH